MKEDMFELSAEEIAAVSGGTEEETPPTEGRGGKYLLAGG
jgi:hypothetical protein